MTSALSFMKVAMHYDMSPEVVKSYPGGDLPFDHHIGLHHVASRRPKGHVTPFTVIKEKEGGGAEISGYSYKTLKKKGIFSHGQVAVKSHGVVKRVKPEDLDNVDDIVQSVKSKIVEMTNR